MEDADVISTLCQVRGVGICTAQMFLMFALERLNIMPVSDFAIRTAVQKAYALDELPKPAELEEIASRWQPYCSVPCWYLWRSLDGLAAVS